MRHYVAIVESEPGKAIGIWFPDVPGCFSGGDTLDEAILNAPEALRLHAEALFDDGATLPPPRTIEALRHDPEASAEMADHMVALIPYDDFPINAAAE